MNFVVRVTTARAVQYARLLWRLAESCRPELPRACQHHRDGGIQTSARRPHSQRDLDQLVARYAGCDSHGG